MKKGGYVDGYVIPIPKKNRGKYRKMASEGKAVWMRFGALDYKECVGEDLYPKMMEGSKHKPFPALTKAKKGEEVWFSFVVYKSKAHRDAVNKKVMVYLAKKYGSAMGEMPFDMRRFSSGGFKVIVGA